MTMLNKKRSGAILCPNCGRLINASASVCIHCGKRNPGMWGFTPHLQRLFGTRSTFVPLIITTCVALYVLSLLIDLRAIFQPSNIFSFLGPSGQSLYRLGMTGAIPIHQGRWWTLFTAIYLHGGLLHILFNMLWTRQLGAMTEELFGTARLMLIFTISGVFGFFVSNTLGVHFTIGASGSIFGLLGALLYYGRKRGGAFGSAIYRQMAMWAFVLLLFGFMMSAVNNYAHIGGFIAGYLSAAALGFNEIKRETAVHRILAFVAMSITAIGFLLSIVI